MAARGRGIVIDLVANVTDFVRGTRKAEDSLDDFGDALDQVARDGDRAAEKLERSFKDTAKAVNQVGDNIKAESKIGSVGSEIGQEFSQNFGEAVRSGNPADAVAETFTSLGPAFGVAGIAAAAGAGIILSVINGAKEKAAAFKAAVTDIASSAFDATIDLAEEAGIGAVQAFQRAWESKALQDEQVRKALGVDSAEAALNELARIAELTGLPVGEIRSAILGNEGAQEQVTAAVKATTAELRRQAGKDGYGSVAQADYDRLLAIEKVVEGEKRVTAAKDQALSAAKTADILDETRVERARLTAKYGAEAATSLERQAAAVGSAARSSSTLLANIQAVERAGTTARGVTNAERYELSRVRP